VAASLDSSSDQRPLVLLVEDEALVRLTLTTMLESGGFRVMPCAHADEALELSTPFPTSRLSSQT
jgi:CheY-like chemotaxis protein